MKFARVQVEAFSVTCPCGYELVAKNGSLMFTPSEVDFADELECPACGEQLRLPARVKLHEAQS